MLLLTTAGVAVLMDLYEMKIKNGWILWSLLTGFLYELWRGGWNGAAFFIAGAGLPLLVLGWMFYFRMLGAGDIKLFCALGGIMGPGAVLWCIWFAFVAGAGISLAVVIFCGNFRQRLQRFAEYLLAFIWTGRRAPYFQKGAVTENIHFTVPIFMSVMLYMGGMY
ncbi:prepilin peptidase [Blautia sp. MSJ-19]|nr:prepilin peptidase [Blautia sp. MSJ-19]MBU5482439.1 prepilin peptidase [Blautia sp. MSJ-19]